MWSRCDPSEGVRVRRRRGQRSGSRQLKSREAAQSGEEHARCGGADCDALSHPLQPRMTAVRVYRAGEHVRGGYTLADRLDARCGLRTVRAGTRPRRREVGFAAPDDVLRDSEACGEPGMNPNLGRAPPSARLPARSGKATLHLGHWPASIGARGTSAVEPSIFLDPAREDGLGACAGSGNEYIPPCFPRLPRRLPLPFSRPFLHPAPPTPRPPLSLTRTT